jgi:hypothetical protein
MCVTFWYSCANNDLLVPPHDLQIQLRWIKSYPTETKNDVMTGLRWTLSFLGANLPKGSMEKAVLWDGEKTFRLDLIAVGFSVAAQQPLSELIAVLKNSNEYRIHGSFDIGRFTMLTLNSPYHYYEITGAKKRLVEFRSLYDFEEKKAGIIHSSIAVGHRVVEISKTNVFHKIAFIGIEGEGSVVENSFEAKEFETLDFMPNGQLKFALYDLDGNLKSAASPSLTRAGKPAKCLWCHEIRLLPPFQDDNQLSEYWSTEEFENMVDERTKLVDQYRKGLNTEIDFSKTQDHTKAELLYLSFMEPSAERIADEWGISLNEVRSRLNGLPIHPHDEFSFLGSQLYHRKDIDHLAPYENIKVADDARDMSVYEPDLISR